MNLSHRATCVRLFLFRFSIAMQKKSLSVSANGRPFLLFFSFPFFFFSKNAVFFQGARGANIGFTAREFQTDAAIGLAIFFKELLKNISEIYLQGRLTAKAQTVCLELGPLCSISTNLPESLGVLTRARFGRT